MGLKKCISGNVDAIGIWKLLKKECETCDTFTKITNGEQCETCIFVKHSSQKKKVKTGIGCRAILKKYGIIEPSELGKHQLFYFLHTPELNFKLPKHFYKRKVDFHHLDGNPNNNTKENIFVCWAGIHGKLQSILRKKNEIFDKFKEVRKGKLKVDNAFNFFQDEILKLKSLYEDECLMKDQMLKELKGGINK